MRPLTWTPLEESHPDKHFAVTSPWYDDLDPETRGMAFNRQYGFVMDGASDLLPLGMAVWIRMLSSDHGLEVYQYRNISETEQIWEPMFGTNGSSEVFAWNMKMFHPAFVGLSGTVEPNRQSLKAYVVDADTGERVQEIDGASFTLSMDSSPTRRHARTIHFPKNCINTGKAPLVITCCSPPTIWTLENGP